ncbi:MAG: response regulator [Deltaproteobacteria bacterium]|nr:response regulator [Deltaproteobacteria bacterium]MBW1794008.1 response regulator [Deltaproteobacteria bacterium]
MKEIEPATVLLVEDDPGDQKLIRVSLNEQRVANELHIVSSGEEALDFLYERGKYCNGTRRPDLILLDLNMPGMGGKEFLTRIKKDEDFKKIPVIVLTTSDSEQDIIDSYNLYASGYVKKPGGLVQFKKVAKEIGEYWFVTCKLPPRLEWSA